MTISHTNGMLGASAVPMIMAGTFVPAKIYHEMLKSKHHPTDIRMARACMYVLPAACTLGVCRAGRDRTGQGFPAALGALSGTVAAFATPALLRRACPLPISLGLGMLVGYGTARYSTRD